MLARTTLCGSKRCSQRFAFCTHNDQANDEEFAQRVLSGLVDVHIELGASAAHRQSMAEAALTMD
jgi:hypothetical protein